MSIGYSPVEIELRWVSDFIRFKQVILKMDIPSRKLVLEKCIQLIESNPDDPYFDVVQSWFNDFLNMSQGDEKRTRKAMLKDYAFWDRIHKALSSLTLKRIIHAVTPK